MQYSGIHDDYVYIHTHCIRSLGRLTRKVTPNYLSTNCIEHLLVRYMYIFFYTFILFVLKIPPLRCARIILYHVLHSMWPYHYYIPIFINVWFTVIYIYIIYNTTLRCAVLVPAVEGLLRARVAIVYNNIYDVYIYTWDVL